MLSVFCSGILYMSIACYPVSGVHNPRVVTYVNAESGVSGSVVPFHGAEFVYRLLPHVRTSCGTHVSMWVRTDGNHVGYKLFSVDGAREGIRSEISLTVSSPGRGRKAVWTLKRNGKDVRTVDLDAPLDSTWRLVTMPFEMDFEGEAFSVCGGLVDELEIRDPAFALKLDWENRSYAARLDVRAGEGAVERRLHGFDTFAVSEDPASRNCPYLEIINSTAAPWKGTTRFSLRGEVSGRRIAWEQESTCPPRSGLMVPVRVPGGLSTDLWHLETSGLERKDFCFVARRKERPGDNKFGWHHVTDRGPGGTMDAFAVPVQVRYMHWPCFVATPWLEDFGKRANENPALPPEEWNWSYGCETAYKEGYPLVLCLQSVPMLAWQRERNFATVPPPSEWWGPRGGLARSELYVPFVAECARRYGKRVLAWEVENEPNAYLMPRDPLQYHKICKMVRDGVKGVLPDARVYGICGTGAYADWMRQAMSAGAGKYLDGPSWHTYTTPNWPDKAGVEGLIAETRSAFGGKPGINTETGTCMVSRYDATNAIPRETVKERRKERAPGFVTHGAFPGPGLDEWEAAANMVRNVAINFRAGSRLFTFFGTVRPIKPDWPKNGEPYFRLLSNDTSGRLVPSLFTLAVGVIAAELEPALSETAAPVDGVFGVEGAVFRKRDGGQTAVLWSRDASAEVLIRSRAESLECVDVFGQRSLLRPTGAGTFRLVLGESPTIVQTASEGIDFVASPVVFAAAMPGEDGGGVLELRFANKRSTMAKIGVSSADRRRLRLSPETSEVVLPPGESAVRQFRYSADRGMESLPISLRLTDGTLLGFGVDVRKRQRATACRTDRASDGKRLSLFRDEQVVVGHAPKNASLQDDSYWKGPDELSATALPSWGDDALTVDVDVTDAYCIAPEKTSWTGGSCVELFFDFREPGRGLGMPSYGKRVHHLILSPDFEKGTCSVRSPQASEPDFLSRAGVSASCRKTGTGYCLTARIPWSLAEREGRPVSGFGFDMAVNGPVPGKPGRVKSKLVLFGTEANNVSAADFGRLDLK